MLGAEDVIATSVEKSPLASVYRIRFSGFYYNSSGTKSTTPTQCIYYIYKFTSGKKKP